MIEFIGTSLQLESMTAYDSLHSVLDYECLHFYCDFLGPDLGIRHFFRFRFPLVNIPQLNTRIPNSFKTASKGEYLTNASN
jgi:hypothetical protein